MARPGLTVDPESGAADISLTEPRADLVTTSVALWPVDDQPDALRWLVLDFDADGRLVGIKVLEPGEALRRETLTESNEA
jgi:hypothetical protein